MGNYIIGVLLLAAVAFSIRKTVLDRKRKKEEGCDGNCSGCSGHCH